MDDLRGLRAAPLYRTSRGLSGGQDPDNQKPKVKGYISDHGMREVEGYTKAVSAFSDPERWARTFAEILADYKAGKFDVLVFLRAERFSRRAFEGMGRFFDLKRAGVRVLSVEDPEFAEIGESRKFPMTRLSMKLEIAEEDSRVKSERVRDGHARVDANAAWRSRPPAGYEIRGEKFAHYLAHGPRAEEIRKALNALAEGKSVNWVTGARGTHKGITTLSTKQIHRIAHNSAYATGRFRVAEGKYHQAKPLVSMDVLLRAQRGIKSRQGVKDLTPWPLEDFSGLLTCDCGLIMYRSRKYWNDKPYYYYKDAASHTANMGKVHSQLDREVARKPLVMRTVMSYHGEGSQAGELRAVEELIESFNVMEGDVQDLIELRKRRDDLKSGDVEPAGLKPVRTTENYSRLWREWNHEQRRQSLIDGEMKVIVHRSPVRIETSYPYATGEGVVSWTQGQAVRDRGSDGVPSIRSQL